VASDKRFISFPFDPYSIPGFLPVLRVEVSMAMNNYAAAFCIMILCFSLVGGYHFLQEHTAPSLGLKNEGNSILLQKTGTHIRD
jgi:hypothetical protein